MAIINFTGFDDGNLIDAMAYGGKIYSETSITCFNTGYALKVQCDSNEVGFMRIGSPANDPAAITGTANYYITFYFYFITAPTVYETDIITLFDSSSNGKLKLVMTSGKQLKLYNIASAFTSLGTGATVLEANKWYQIGLRSGTGASANYDVQIDATSVLSGTYSGTVNNGLVELGRKGDWATDPFEFYYDDYVVDDAAFQWNLHTKILVANAAGTNNAWTAVGDATPYLTTVQIPSDSETYLTSTTPSQISTFNIQDSTTVNISGTITAVKELVVGFQEATNNINAYMLYSGNTVTTNNAVITYRMALGFLRVVAPGGASWTTTILDALELGISAAATSNVKVVTSIYGLVLWQPNTFSYNMTGTIVHSGGAYVPRDTTIVDVTGSISTHPGTGLIVEEYDSAFTNSNDVMAGNGSNDEALVVEIPSTPRIITIVRKIR